MSKAIKIRLVHSPAGRYPKQRATIVGLGLRHVCQERVLEDTPAVRGMVAKVSHLVKIVEEGLTLEARNS
jgi:large subunit ribosomal protein L30